MAVVEENRPPEPSGNIFDQIDPPEQSGNIFDQIDPPEPQGNVFDQIDPPAQTGETEQVYLLETGQTVEVPKGASFGQVRRAAAEQEQSPENLFGTTHIGEEAFDDPSREESTRMGRFAAGLGEFFVTLPAQFAPLATEQGERLDVLADGSPTDVLKIGLTNPLRAPMLGTDLLTAKLFPDLGERMAEKSKQMQRDYMRYLHEHDLLMDDEDRETLSAKIGSGFGSLAFNVGLLLVTKRPAVTGVTFGAMQKADAYQELRENGFDVASAGALSTLEGAAVGAIEFVGDKVLFGIITKPKGVVSSAISATIQNALEEGTQQGIEEFSRGVLGVRNDSASAKAMRIAEAMLVGGVVGAPVGGASGLVHKLTGRDSIKGMTPEQVAEKIIAHHVEQNKDQVAKEIADDIAVELLPGTRDESTRKRVANAFNALNKGLDVERVMDTAESRERAIDDILGRAAEVRAETQDTVRRGRVRLLDRQIREIDRQMEDLERESTRRIKEGKPTERIENQLDTLFERRDTLDDERISLLGEQAQVDASRNVEVRGDTIVKQALTGQQRGLRKTIRDISRLAKEDVKAAQQSLLKFVDSLRLEGKDGKPGKHVLTDGERRRLTNAILQATNAEQVTRQANRVRSRASRMIDKRMRRAMRDRMVDLLKQTNPKKQGNRPIGKFDAAFQRVFDHVRSVVMPNGKRITIKEAQKLLEDRREALADPDSSPVNSIENALTDRFLSMIANDDQTGTLDMAEFVDDFQALVRSGQIRGQMRILERMRRIGEGRRAIVEAVTGQAVDPESDAATQAVVEADAISKPDLRERSKRAVRDMVSPIINDWRQLMDIIAENIPKAKLEAFLEMFDVFNAEARLRELNERFQQTFEAAVMRAYGITNPNEISSRLRQLRKEANHGVVTNAHGNKVNWSNETGSSMLWKWMNLQAEANRKRMVEVNGYTDEMIDIVEGSLTQEDRKLGLALLELFRDQYDGINEVYSSINGVDLPRIADYMPIYSSSTATSDDAGAMTSFTSDDQLRRLGISQRFAKERSESSRVLDGLDALDVVSKWHNEVQTYMAFAETIQFLDGVLKNNGVKALLIKRHGATLYNEITKALDEFARRGHKETGAVAKFLTTLRKNFTSAKLAGKVLIGIKQLSSLPFMARDVPAGVFTRGLVDFALNPRLAFNTLSKHPIIRTRTQHTNLDIEDIINSRELISFSRSGRLNELLSLATRMGDAFPVYVGGWAVYKHNIEQGKSPEKALEIAAKTAEETQQSSLQSRLASGQKNAYSRIAFVFQSAPLAQLRVVTEAMRRAARGQISKRDLARRLMVAWLIQPQLLQMAANAGQFVVAEQARAAIMGPFNGLPIAAQAMNRLASVLLDLPYYDAEVWMYSLLDDVLDEFSDLLGSDDWDDVVEHMIEIGKLSIEVGTGFPANTVVDISTGVTTAISDAATETDSEQALDDLHRGLLITLGYTPTRAARLTEEQD